jgi:hypothetical protein
MLSAGTNVDWLRDDLGLIATSAESHDVAAMCDDTGGVVYVPALLGLGTPKWDYGARGTLLGITRGTSRQHVVRAVLEGSPIVAPTCSTRPRADSGVDIHTVRIDGGMSANPTFTQALADAADCPIEVAPVAESTTIGAAFMAGLGVGVFTSMDDLDALWAPARRRTERPVDTPPSAASAGPTRSNAPADGTRICRHSSSERSPDDRPLALELLGRPPSGKAVVRMTPKGPSPVDLESAAPPTSRRSLIGALGAAGLASAAALAISRPASAAPPSSPTADDRELLREAMRFELAAGALYREAAAAGLDEVATELAVVFAENHVTYADEIAGISGILRRLDERGHLRRVQLCVRHRRRRGLHRRRRSAWRTPPQPPTPHCSPTTSR